MNLPKCSLLEIELNGGDSTILALWLKTLELMNSKTIVKYKKKLSGKVRSV
jgi:hypothetical protein